MVGSGKSKKSVRKKKQNRDFLRPCAKRVVKLKMREEEVSEVGEDKQKKIILSTSEFSNTSNQLDCKMETSEERNEGAIGHLGLPLLQPSIQKPTSRVIFVLENASLVPALVGRRYEILNPDDHASYMRRKNMNPYDYRPDIVYEALCEIMDSRIRMAGLLKTVYIKTDAGVLIKVEPNASIPRTFGKFCNMMVELLQKLSIKSRCGRVKLLRLVENPVTKHLPANCKKIGLSFSSKKAVELDDYVVNIKNDEDLVFVVGAMAHGKIKDDYVDDLISVSEFPLGADTCLRHILLALERRWRIL